ncbi:MAG: amidohydrolase [Bacillus sp. (in: Bacteria)]|nr:amidohydrolase [Bacillus sp. (in: firmicutes)]
MGTLWYGGTIYTMDKENEQVEAVYTSNGVIQGVGPLTQLEQMFSSSIEQRIDLKGATMLPGLVDSHMHLIGLGEMLHRLDLSTCRSKKELLTKVREKVNETKDGEWIIGEGWNENLWADADELTRWDLDPITNIHPILLKRVCRHALVVNTVALNLCGITEQTKEPFGGVIERKNGALSGVFKDDAQQLIFNRIPKASIAYLEDALKRAIEHCWKHGIVGGHTEDLSYYSGFKTTYQAFHHVIHESDYPFRAHLLVHHHVIDDWYKEGHTYLSGTPFIRFGAMKIFADGSLGGRTALLSVPYADDPSTQGVAIHTLPELKELVQKARKMELPVAIHTIGDLAFEYALEAISACLPKNGQRDRLIHAQLLREELIRKAQSLPVVLDIQPLFVASDFPWVLERVNKNNIPYLYAWKTLLNASIPCAGGSDAPIERVNPFHSIYTAITRKKPNDPSTAYLPEEALTPYEAFRLYTVGSAYAAQEENKRGCIKNGHVADFTIVNHDVMNVPPEQLLNSEVVMTVVNEKIVYSRKQ